MRNSLQKLQDEYGRLDAKLSEIEAQKGRNSRPRSHNITSPEEIVVLKPTWVGSGETTPAFDGKLRIVLYKASDKGECQKDSEVVSYLIGDTDKKKLCLRTGKPENFTYQGKNYLFNLSGIAAQASVYRYCISISLDQQNQ